MSDLYTIPLWHVNPRLISSVSDVYRYRLGGSNWSRYRYGIGTSAFGISIAIVTLLLVVIANRPGRHDPSSSCTVAVIVFQSRYTCILSLSSPLSLF